LNSSASSQAAFPPPQQQKKTKKRRSGGKKHRCKNKSESTSVACEISSAFDLCSTTLWGIDASWCEEAVIPQKPPDLSYGPTGRFFFFQGRICPSHLSSIIFLYVVLFFVATYNL
jgi:hypothetical protein